MIISPSILNANYINLEKDIIELERSGADAIHIDIMDGRFVEPITWGPSTIAAIRGGTDLALEAHLMIDKPETKVQEYINTGADIIMIHPESTVFLRKTLLSIKEGGVKAGIALKLETPVDTIIHCLELIDVVLLVTCDEGFGGRPFHPLAINKITYLTDLKKKLHFDFDIEVDGGIDLDTGKECKAAGANRLVAGSFVFNNNKRKAIADLKNI